MRTRANENYVASDRAQRENVPRHILCSGKNLVTLILERDCSKGPSYV